MTPSSLRQQIKVLRMLEEREKRVGDLYEAFATSFLENKKFWKELAAEEREHAALLSSFEDDIYDGTLNIAPGLFDLAGLEILIKNLENMAVLAEKNKLPLKAAMEDAYDLEFRMFESKVFEKLTHASTKLKDIFDKLAAANKKHARRIKDEIDKLNLE